MSFDCDISILFIDSDSHLGTYPFHVSISLPIENGFQHVSKQFCFHIVGSFHSICLIHMQFSRISVFAIFVFVVFLSIVVRFIFSIFSLVVDHVANRFVACNRRMHARYDFDFHVAVLA